MIGVWINVGTVLAGGSLGAWLGDRLPARVREIVMQGLGLLTLVIGMGMALKSANPLYVLGGILAGGMLGEWCNVQARLDGVGAWLSARAARHPFLARGDFTRGFVTATLVFCVGPMTIMGSIQEGLSGDASLIIVKSTLDAFSSLAMAAVMGMGVTFAALSVLLIQGTLTLGGGLFAHILTPPMVTEMTATGGVMILGIGFLLLELKQLRVANFLPALFVAPALVAAQPWLAAWWK